MRAFCIFLACLACLALPAAARARSDSEFAYPFARVWTAAVRLLRVDLGCPITEKDKEEGYFFFDYPGDSGPLPGSVELVRTRMNGVEGVKVIVQVPAMPSYVERVVLDKLGRKLNAEFGAPLSQEPPKAAQASAEKSTAQGKSADREKGEGEQRKQGSANKKQEPDKK